MAGRQSTPQHGTIFAVKAALLLLAAWFAAPAMAAPHLETRCDDVADASLDIPAHKLTADAVSHDVGAEDGETESANDVLTPSRYLAPQAEERVREAFEDVAPPLAEAAPVSDDDVDRADEEARPSVKSRLPGVSDSELARYRRQMYRIDI